MGNDTAEKKYIFIVGERATITCNVTAQDPKLQLLYWKKDNDVMSEEDVVVPKFKDKYKVTLDRTVPDNVTYSITFIVEKDDVGNYNCTCASGGIQYPVWVKGKYHETIRNLQQL